MGWVRQRPLALLALAAACGAEQRDAYAAPPDIMRTPATVAATGYQLSAADHELLDQIQRGCFNYLWNEVGRPSGMAKDRRTTLVASTAGVGFQLSALPVAVERGWITREQGEQRALSILHTLLDRSDNRLDGVFLHFVQADDGAVYPPFHNEIATVDHALLLAGAMPAASYFGAEVASLVDRMAAETNWRRFYTPATQLMSFAWIPDDHENLQGAGRLHPLDWKVASDEERLIYFLAVGSPTAAYAADPADYYRLQRSVMSHGDGEPFVAAVNGSLFCYFFSHCWIDYRGMEADDPSQFGVAGPRVDWFENSRRATLAHRQRCIEVADRFPTLGANRWGLSPCMGYTERGEIHYLVPQVRPNLSDRDEWQGGVVAPYAAGSAIMFTPAESLAALRAFRDLRDAAGRPLVWRDPALGAYGLADSFSLAPARACDDNVAIDVGPMLLAIENVRTGLVWKLFMEHPLARTAVERLKFQPLTMGAISLPDTGASEE